MPATAAKLVDADTHVSENEQMWEHFEREMYHRRPVLISVPENTLYGDRNAM
jgi:ribosomal protein S10